MASMDLGELLNRAALRRALAERVVALAEIGEGYTVLEPKEVNHV